MFRKIKYCIFLLFIIFVFKINNDIFAENLNKNLNILELINYNWWVDFNDNNLQKIIIKGISENNDLKIAQLKLKEYKEFVKYTFGQELPTITADFNYTNINNISFMNKKIRKDGIVLPLTMNYEIDLFGKNRSKTKSVKKQLEIYELQLKSSYISLVSTIATLYFNLIRFNELIKLQKKIIFIKHEIFDKSLISNKNGILNNIELNNLEQDLITAKNILNELLKNRDIILSQLAILIGENPMLLKNIDISDFNDINFSKTNISELSSDMIFNRPDIITAEKEVEKSNINISIARKEFLPTFTISGSILFNNITSGGFFNIGNSIKMLLFSASENLFVGGRKKANLRINNIKLDQNLENYKKISLQAIKEINDSLYSLKYDKSISFENTNKFLLEINSQNNYNIMYKNGLISEIDLFKLKQKDISLRSDIVSSKIDEIIDIISLYKATGAKLK